jgi:hypothetical protein
MHKCWCSVPAERISATELMRELSDIVNNYERETGSKGVKSTALDASNLSDKNPQERSSECQSENPLWSSSSSSSSSSSN